MKKDKSILLHMIKYCTEISETIVAMELDFAKFEESHIARNAISMCILQIGELANKFSDDFKLKHSKIPWKDVVSMRHRAAHGYYEMDKITIWKTATNDVPKLKSYCEKIIEEKDDD